MFRRTSLIAFALTASLVASDALARNPLYYGTPRRAPARFYSGEWQAQRPNVVPTFSVPYYSGGYYAPRWRGGYAPVYPQPVIVYPPAVYGGYGVGYGPAAGFGYGW